MTTLLKSRIRKVGGSMMFRVPKPIADGLGLRADTDVELSISNGRLIVDPHPRKKYTLDELLSQCDPSIPMSAEDKAWLGDSPVGREEI